MTTNVLHRVDPTRLRSLAVTAAVIGLFAGFVAGEIVAMKQLGLGLALAVIIDATVVRILLVPATMKLMGRWNWWPGRRSEPVPGPGVGDLFPGVAERAHGDARDQQLAPDAMALQAHE